MQTDNFTTNRDMQTDKLDWNNTGSLNENILTKTVEKQNNPQQTVNEFESNIIYDNDNNDEEKKTEILSNTQDTSTQNALLDSIQAIPVTRNIDDIPIAEGTLVTHNNAASLVNSGNYDKLAEARKKYIELGGTKIPSNNKNKSFLKLETANNNIMTKNNYLNELNETKKITKDKKKVYTDFLSKYYDDVTGKENKSLIKEMLEQIEF
jgi:hypothetical protein